MKKVFGFILAAFVCGMLVACSNTTCCDKQCSAKCSAGCTCGDNCKCTPDQKCNCCCTCNKK